MATRSSIAYKTERGVTAIYCHWDGYPAHNGKILEENYQAAYLIGKLIAGGDLSSLRENIFPPAGASHDFENSLDDVCVYYGRDRGEKGTEPKEFADVKEWVEHYDGAGCEYFYLWNGKEWLVHHYAETDSMGFPFFEINKDKVDFEIKRLKAMGYEV